MRTVTKAVLAAVTLLVTVAANASAQRIQVVPRAGVFVSGSSLGEVREGTEAIKADLEGGLGVGLGIELGMPVSPVGFRAGFDYATDSKISTSGINEGSAEAGAKLLAVAGDLVFRPLPQLLVVQPYLLAGAGLKRYDFEVSELDAGVRDIFESQTDFALHGGAGLDVSLGAIALRAEVSDYLSWFQLASESEKEMQHDVFATVGLRISLF
mgnify:CR=1 FL=1